MTFQITSQSFLLFRQEKIKANYNKREFTKANKAAFKQQLSLLDWRHVNYQKDVNKMYETFLGTFLETCKTNFPFKQVTVKPKDVKNPWMRKTLKKSSIQKQTLYVKYLRQKMTESEKNLQTLQKSI